jgi:hypothetical protein
MAGSDRAFRSLAHHEPETVVALLRLLAPHVAPPGAVALPEDAAPTRLDVLPPPLEVDSALRLGASVLAHTECQGYGDAGFPTRVFWYHLELAVRNRTRHVKTVALWLLRPPEAQRRSELEQGDIRVKITHVFLPDEPAERLLADPTTACFAAAADPGSRSIEGLCREVARQLKATEASWPRRHVAVVCAATQGRYHAMLEAMASEGLEPVIIEDLVKFGEDMGLQKGLEQGLEQGLERGLERGLAPLLRLFGRRLGRPLDEREQAEVRRRLEALGPDRLGDVVLDLGADELGRWLADPDAT